MPKITRLGGVTDAAQLEEDEHDDLPGPPDDQGEPEPDTAKPRRRRRGTRSQHNKEG